MQYFGSTMNLALKGNCNKGKILNTMFKLVDKFECDFQRNILSPPEPLRNFVSVIGIK